MGSPADPLVVARILDREWPDAACELRWRDPWELLVATILSQRATDIAVIRAMAVLQEHLLGVATYAECDHRDLALLIRHLPLYQQKARAIVESARALMDHHAGQVPRDPHQLAQLPGVGRKTAAVVAGNAFNVPAVAADTHVCRLALRFGWTASEDPLLAERALTSRFPEADWVRRCHQLIRLGRDHCKRVKPRCERCPLVEHCPQQGVAG